MNKQGYKSIDRKEYANLHQWLRRMYGSAICCENNCGEIRKGYFDWALIHGKKYERKRENFMMLCKKCHHLYDKISRFGPLHPMFGKKHTKATRKKMSLNSKHGKPNLGKKASLKTRKKMSLTRKGVPKSDAHKRKISEGNMGKKLSEEHKQKLSVLHINKKHNKETKIKMSLVRIGKTHTKKTREKMKLSALKRWKDM